MDLKDSEGGSVGRIGGRKGREKRCNYNLKYKRKNGKIFKVK